MRFAEFEAIDVRLNATLQAVGETTPVTVTPDWTNLECMEITTITSDISQLRLVLREVFDVIDRCPVLRR